MDKSEKYYPYSQYLKERYGEKVYKLPVNLPVSCPNRINGNGCSFCAEKGTGFEAMDSAVSVTEQLLRTRDYIEKRYHAHKFIAYFQNFTNTHAPLEVIKDRYEQAINEPGVVGINIGTRPDCLPDDVIDYLAELTERMHVTVELGLQTTYEETSELINRAHSYELYVETVKRLRERAPKAEIVSHLINGLPGETHEMMVENVRRCVTDNDIQGIKLHLLHLMTNTRMQRDYHEGGLKLLSQEEYVSIICDQLEIIPKDIVIHRITGDAPRDMLIGPMWSLNKWEVLNAIDKEMERRDSWQGCKVVSKKEEKA